MQLWMPLALGVLLVTACNGRNPVLSLEGGARDAAAFDGISDSSRSEGSKADLIRDTRRVDKTCTQYGDTCLQPAECCSGVCLVGKCVPPNCVFTAMPCSLPTDCCSLNCTEGKCAGPICKVDGANCTTAGVPCCSTTCLNGKCQPIPTPNGCKTAGNPCPGGDSDCCSKVCFNGSCAPPSKISFCTQTYDICFQNTDCCSLICIGSGGKAGYCAAIPGSCLIDGILCSGCNACCSSFCAPSSFGGQKLCQPASGCRVTGDLCHKDSDCCGGDIAQLSKIPGAGLVKCVPNPANPQIGTCSEPNPANCPTGLGCGPACVPEGDICHSTELGGCPVNATRDDCCSGPGTKGMCKLDKLGIPRCQQLGPCVAAGGDCAFSGDCCNGLPCVPDAMGHLKCAAQNCVKQGGFCTTTSDCCSGLVCQMPPGVLAGTCQAPILPQPIKDAGPP